MCKGGQIMATIKTNKAPEYSRYLAEKVSNIFFITLLGIALFISSSVLSWATVNKFQTERPIEGTNITAKVREQQLNCLARNIYYEAGNEPFEGKVAVAQVTLNRLEHKDFPKDICQVVQQKNIIYKKVLCQFSWYCTNPSKRNMVNKDAFEESMTVAKKVLLEDFRLPGLDEAMYYHADYVKPKWNKEKITTIGSHIFYK